HCRPSTAHGYSLRLPKERGLEPFELVIDVIGRQPVLDELVTVAYDLLQALRLGVEAQALLDLDGVRRDHIDDVHRVVSLRAAAIRWGARAQPPGGCQPCTTIAAAARDSPRDASPSRPRPPCTRT